MQVVHYFDYKSPYSYLAQEETFRLADDFAIELVLRPYTLDIPDFLGRAEVDAAGNRVIDERSPHNWRRVHYIYMDCRREAARRGLTLRGPRRVFDSSIAHIAFLYAGRHGTARPYHDAVYERFWRRELDIEDVALVTATLEQAGVDTSSFAEYLQSEGRAEHDRIRNEAEEAGVFGVPSYLIDGELYFGNERLPRVRERIESSASV